MSHALRPGFLLRLPVTLREQATDLAKAEGTSLNHLISLALTEKVARMQTTHLPPIPVSRPAPRPDPNHPYYPVSRHLAPPMAALRSR